MTKQVVALATATLAMLSASASLAADKTLGSKMGGSMMHGKTMGKGNMMHGVYACKMCKAYYTPAQAKKMGYKDPMGHKLTMMAKAPAGYKMGGSMKGGGMMHGGTMHGGKLNDNFFHGGGKNDTHDVSPGGGSSSKM